MNPRVLHLAATLETSAGIVYQMESEKKAAQALGLSWECRLFVLRTHANDEKSTVVKVWQGPTKHLLNRALGWFYLRLRLFFYILKIHKQFDLILLRYTPHDPIQTLLFLVLGRKTMSVHHTKEIEELSGPKFASRFRSGFEKILGKVTLSLHSGLIAVTEEILDYETSRATFPPRFGYVYANGILLREPEVNDERDDIPTFLFVASEFQKWHGLDRLIEAARTFEGTFTVHIVGRLPDSIAASLARDTRFVVHGMLRPAEIRYLACKAWAGLSSFALDRNQMTQASTLKVREYLQWGLPVIADYEDVFPKDFRYYCRSAADFRSLIVAAESFRFVSRADVRSASEPYISKILLLDRLAMEIKGHINSPFAKRCRG